MGNRSAQSRVPAPCSSSRSRRERVILVSGYTPPLLREWPGNEISPEFIATLPEAIRPIISGSDSWHWKRRY